MRSRGYLLCASRGLLQQVCQSSVDGVGFIPILSSKNLSFTISCFSERHSTSDFLVFLMVGMAWGQKWAQHPYFSRWSVWAEKLYYSTLKVSFHHWWEVLSWGGRVDVMSSFSLLAYGEGMGISEWFQPSARIFLEMFTQIWSLSGPAMIHKLACSHYSERQTVRGQFQH